MTPRPGLVSFMNCPETTPDLNYASLMMDEAARIGRGPTFPRDKRFSKTLKNGNLKTIIPNIDDDDVRKALAPCWQVDSSTHTVFRDEFYKTHVTIEDRVDSSNHLLPSVAMQLEGHSNCNSYASGDTRVLHFKSAYQPYIGPGHYETDPMGEMETGTLKMGAPGEVHRATSIARDPTRQSSAFVAPERGFTARDVMDAQCRPPLSAEMRGLDFADWTAKGFSLSKGERLIEAERWGPSARDRRPPPTDYCASMYSPDTGTDGRPTTCGSYTRSVDTPSYAAAFNSSLPRLVGLPTAPMPDTRLWMRSSALMSTTGRLVGPGSYKLEEPRLRSCNANYKNSDVYHSLSSCNPLGGEDTSPWRMAKLAAKGVIPGSASGGSSPGRRRIKLKQSHRDILAGSPSQNMNSQQMSDSPVPEEWHPTNPAPRKLIAELSVPPSPVRHSPSPTHRAPYSPSRNASHSPARTPHSPSALHRGLSSSSVGDLLAPRNGTAPSEVDSPRGGLPRGLSISASSPSFIAAMAENSGGSDVATAMAAQWGAQQPNPSAPGGSRAHTGGNGEQWDAELDQHALDAQAWEAGDGQQYPQDHYPHDTYPHEVSFAATATPSPLPPSPPRGLAAAIREVIREQMRAVRSAPSTPTGSHEGNQLNFNRRTVPYQAYIKSHLRASADLKRERLLLRAAAGGNEHKRSMT